MFSFVVITYSWALGIFATSFKPEAVLKFEQQHKIDNNSTYVEFWRKNRVGKQIKGKSFYLLVGADVVVFVVLLLSFIEFNLSRVVNRGYDDDELRMSQEQLIIHD